MELLSTKRRIRHIYHHNGPAPDWGKNPRGWITPDGRFLETKEHWRSITYQFRRPEIRSDDAVSAEESAEGERVAQLAYNLGWISLGHAGELNAIGHERTFRSTQNPAALALRQLLSNSPDLSIHIELQIGLFNPSLRVHEDFDVRTYDLDRFIKRGKLIEVL
jgi:hypothetical protein